MNKIKVLIKRTISYFKKNWDFYDYPMKIWKNANAGEINVSYGACIINWWFMVGYGETPEKALESLKITFKWYKDNNDSLPRPGKKVPMKYASSEKINLYEKTGIDFFKNVLEMDYHNGFNFFSDNSYLTYFEPRDDNELAREFKEKIIKQTLLVYNVDIIDIYDEPLWKILERIDLKIKNSNLNDMRTNGI